MCKKKALLNTCLCLCSFTHSDDLGAASIWRAAPPSKAIWAGNNCEYELAPFLTRMLSITRTLCERMHADVSLSVSVAFVPACVTELVCVLLVVFVFFVVTVVHCMHTRLGMRTEAVSCAKWVHMHVQPKEYTSCQHGFITKGRNGSVHACMCI